MTADTGVCEESRKNGGVLKAKAGAGAVVRRCSMCCIAGDGDAVLEECRDGVFR